MKIRDQIVISYTDDKIQKECCKYGLNRINAKNIKTTENLEGIDIVAWINNDKLIDPPPSNSYFIEIFLGYTYPDSYNIFGNNFLGLGYTLLTGKSPIVKVPPKVPKVRKGRPGNLIEIYITSYNAEGKPSKFESVPVEIKNYFELFKEEIKKKISVSSDFSNNTSKSQEKPISKYNNENLSKSSPDNTTVKYSKKASFSVEKGEIPSFQPSMAVIPLSFNDNGSDIDNLNYSLYNHSNSIQSFFNDLPLIKNNNSRIEFNDQVLTIQPFDEGIYCDLVKEMHKFKIAELTDEKVKKAADNAQIGAAIGGIAGLFSGNFLGPFGGAAIGAGMAERMSDKMTTLEKLLPSPKLLFLQDKYSFSSIGRGHLAIHRRVILHPFKTIDSKLYFRAIPAVVTNQYVIPMQVFKAGVNSYFLRSIAAGIDRHQKNYDAIKLFRRYNHTRSADGSSKDTGEEIIVTGTDIEDKTYKLYSYSSDIQNLNYLYFDYMKEPGCVY